MNKKRTYQKLMHNNSDGFGVFFWQQYDESGKIESVAFDFKGNLLAKKQFVISSAELKTALDNYNTYLVDWTGLPSILGSQVFETSSEFDALNRATKITLPENVENDRKEIVPTYNRAGALQKVHYDNTEYVENIAYNAKGQRLLIAFGNQIMTRYVYDNRTFRLERQKSEKYTFSQVGDTLTYTPNSGNTKQDDKYIYDLIGNILNINIRTTACGVGGTNSLDREFEYDPLYRLISGTGRDNVPGGNYPFPGWDDNTRSTTPNTTQEYKRKYKYDKLGNILELKQTKNNTFTRTYEYISQSNKLNNITIGSNDYNYTYDNVGNQLTENTERKFGWDAANRLLSFKNQVGSAEPTVLAQYLYDSGGNRVKKIVRKQGGGYEIRTYIDGVFEYYTDETEEQNTVHIMDDQSRVATVRIGDAMGDTTPAIKYNLENNVGSSTVVLNHLGAIVNTQEYYPFGETSFGSYAKKRYQYTGKERDEESGLYYYGARYYAAWTCRFISVDPLAGKYSSLNPYIYAFNNPLAFNDPTGMEGEKASASADNISTDGGGDTGNTDGGGEPSSDGGDEEKSKAKNESKDAEEKIDVDGVEGSVTNEEDSTIVTDYVEKGIKKDVLPDTGDWIYRETTGTQESEGAEKNTPVEKAETREQSDAEKGTRYAGGVVKDASEKASDPNKNKPEFKKGDTIESKAKKLETFKNAQKFFKTLYTVLNDVLKFLGIVDLADTIVTTVYNSIKTGLVYWGEVVKIAVDFASVFVKEPIVQFAIFTAEISGTLKKIYNYIDEKINPINFNKDKMDKFIYSPKF